MTEREEMSKSLWLLMKENFPLKQFLIGALVPILLFYSFHRVDEALLGAFLASSWGIGVSVVTRFILKNTNLFAVLSIPFSLIELAGISVTLNPDFYLLWPAVGKTLWGLIYLGSVVVSRPLILIIAQAMGMFPKSDDLGDFSNTDLFCSAWVILTVIWGLVHLIVAVLLFTSHYWFPLETFLIIRIASGTPILAALIAFSFWFPRWYWDRSSSTT